MGISRLTNYDIQQVSTYSRFGSNNINSSMAAGGLGGKSGRSSHIECIIVVGEFW
jgi:hypothetical protein